MVKSVVSEALEQLEQKATLTLPQLEELLNGKLEFVRQPIDLRTKARVEELTLEALANGLSANTVDRKQVHLAALADVEEELYTCANLLVQYQQPSTFARLFEALKEHFNVFPKARIAKIIRTLIETSAKCKNTEAQQMDFCHQVCTWCDSSNLLFLKYRLETYIVHLLLATGKFSQALSLVTRLTEDVKNQDDKLLLIELYVLESKLCLFTNNIGRSNAALTNARTTANGVNCPPYLQAAIDLTSGRVHADQLDYTTALSYLIEAFDGYSNLRDEEPSADALSYVMLCLMLVNQSAEIESLVKGEFALELLKAPKVIAISQLAKAYNSKNLRTYNDVLIQHRNIFDEDIFLRKHIALSSEKVAQRAILDQVGPYSVIDIAYIASETCLSPAEVENHLSKMILDGMIQGILDQKKGVFELYSDNSDNSTYELTRDICKDLVIVVNKMSSHINNIE